MLALYYIKEHKKDKLFNSKCRVSLWFCSIIRNPFLFIIHARIFLLYLKYRFLRGFKSIVPLLMFWVRLQIIVSLLCLVEHKHTDIAIRKHARGLFDKPP